MDVVCVTIGERRVAVPAANVREVTQAQAVTPAPTAPPPVAGLMQLRGQILPILDVAGLLSEPGRLLGTASAQAPRLAPLGSPIDSGKRLGTASAQAPRTASAPLSPIDSGKRLGSPTRLPRPNDHLLVVERGALWAALLVDQVHGVQADDGGAVLDVGALFDEVRARIAEVAA